MLPPAAEALRYPLITPSLLRARYDALAAVWSGLRSTFLPAVLLAALAAGAPSVTTFDEAAAPFTTSFDVSAPAEVIATITARCNACAWDVAGREAATLTISLDGGYVAHLPLVRQGVADYAVLLGGVSAGRHVVRAEVDRDLTATGLKHDTAAVVERIELRSVPRGAPDHIAIALAPILYARPNTIGRFTDVPVFMWYEREPTPRGTRYRYSVVFTNEDGGTPADRLMATWGRTTDIEYVYSVEVDETGRILGDDFQGPDHKILPFAGKREGLHPLLWVVTDNNMVLDQGATRVRYVPAPAAFPLEGVSREAVMDANPWLYAVAAQELAREGKIADAAPPGRGTIPDPRRFVYIEACGEVGAAAIAFELGVRDRWERSDRGVREYKIVRNGCFRAAVPLPDSFGPNDVRALRLITYQRPARDGSSASGAAAVRIDRVNTVFMLDDDHRPGRPLLEWKGPTMIEVGSSFEIPIVSRR